MPTLLHEQICTTYMYVRIYTYVLCYLMIILRYILYLQKVLTIYEYMIWNLSSCCDRCSGFSVGYLICESSGFNGSIHPFSQPSIDCKSSLSAVMESSLSAIMEYSKWYSRVVSAFLTSDSANGHFSGGHKQFKIQLELKMNGLKTTLPISSSIDDYMLVFGQIKWFMGICLSTDIYTIHSCSSLLW